MSKAQKEKVRPLRFQQGEQVAGETVDRRHRLAARTGHLGQGMKHLVDERMGVDHPDRLPGKTLRRRADRAVLRLEHRGNRRRTVIGRRRAGRGRGPAADGSVASGSKPGSRGVAGLKRFAIAGFARQDSGLPHGQQEPWWSMLSPLRGGVKVVTDHAGISRKGAKTQRRKGRKRGREGRLDCPIRRRFTPPPFFLCDFALSVFA